MARHLVRISDPLELLLLVSGTLLARSLTKDIAIDILGCELPKHALPTGGLRAQGTVALATLRIGITIAFFTLLVGRLCARESLQRAWI